MTNNKSNWTQISVDETIQWQCDKAPVLRKSIILSFFTGELLTAMPNVSYFFEPLWFLSRSNKSQEPSVTEVSRVLKIPFLAREFNSSSSSNFEINYTNSRQKKKTCYSNFNQSQINFIKCNKAKTLSKTIDAPLISSLVTHRKLDLWPNC